MYSPCIQKNNEALAKVQIFFCMCCHHFTEFIIVSVNYVVSCYEIPSQVLISLYTSNDSICLPKFLSVADLIKILSKPSNWSLHFNLNEWWLLRLPPDGLELYSSCRSVLSEEIIVICFHAVASLSSPLVKTDTFPWCYHRVPEDTRGQTWITARRLLVFIFSERAEMN